MQKTFHSLLKNYLLLAVLFYAISVKSYGQSICCLVDSIKINTGYNPLIHSAIAGADGSIVPDKRWKVSSYSADVSTHASPWTLVSPGGPADVVASGGGSMSACNPISCMDGSYYNTGGVAGYDYYMDLQRDFYLVKASQVTISGDLECDDGVEVYLDHILMDTLGVGIGYHFSNWLTPNPFSYTTPDTLSGCATHTILVRVHNYNFIAPDSSYVANGTFLKINGTVTSLVPLALRREDNTACNLNPAHCDLQGVYGPNEVCVGNTIRIFDSVDGSWSSGNTSIATIVDVNGIVTGISAGTVTMTFTDLCGRSVTYLVTVNPLPAAITGTLSVCQGLTTTLHDVSTVGGWTSGNTGVATVGASSGVVTGISVGTATITYTLTTGCLTTAVVTVNPLPAVISGTLDFCPGTTTTLTDSAAGGTWSSSNTGVATVGSSSGIVNGISAGTSTITYMLTATGCIATTVVTVEPLPGPITGPLVMCVFESVTLTDAAAGGTWTSSNTAVADVILPYGLIGGLSAGTATITYSVLCGTVTVTVTVNPLPAPITGPSSVCVGATITLSDPTAGGLWTSAFLSGSVTVGSTTGVVTGVSSGLAAVVYTLPTGCIQWVPITVIPQPGAILGPLTVCTGSTSLLSDTTAGGIWTSSNTGVATIGSSSGVVNGLSPGTSTITYTATTTGCYITAAVTVNPTPPVITGIMAVCVGATTTLVDILGGSWTSSNTSVATIGSGSGVVTGLSAGTAHITYTMPTSCLTIATVTVNPLPSAITGMPLFCAGSKDTLSDIDADGTWSTTSPIVSVGLTSGIVTSFGVTGTVTITYTLSTGCSTTTTLTIITLPPPISGVTLLCAGDMTSLTDATLGGGVWSSSNTSVATVNPTTGVVIGVSGGTALISYTNICGPAVITVTVNPMPAPFIGPFFVCVGSTILLSDASLGGTWSSSNTGIATIGSSTGIVTGISKGISTIIYRLVSTGCSRSRSVIVNPLPDGISGTLSLCVGSTTTFSDDSTGGTWSSGNTVVATIGSSTGVVTAVAAGTSTITYTLATGCSVTIVLTVNPLPAAITGTTTVCEGSTSVLHDVTFGGTWSSSNTAIASVSSGGLFTGISSGTATITYSLSTGCIATATVLVNPLPAAITGIESVCVGLTTLLSDATGGGTWTSGNTSVATIGSSTGLVTGISSGTAIITYALSSTGCFRVATVTINPLPSVITGPDTICSGAPVALSDSVSGGTWSSSDTLVAVVDATTGVVTGGNIGIATITYTLSTGCLITTSVIIDSLPVVPPIVGTDSICVAGTTIFSDALGGGSWNSSNTAVATIGSGTGFITGVRAGSSTISYTIMSSCGPSIVTRVISIVILPAVLPITGILAVCSGMTDTLHDAVSGGIWTSGNTAIATIDSVTGVVSGLTSGMVEITYTVTNICGPTSVHVTVNVNMPPYITTNTTVACQILDRFPPFFLPVYVLSDTGCVLVCQGSTVRYYANGNVGSAFTWGAVIGGIVVANYGDSIDILWPVAGVTGSITLFDTVSHCMGEAVACIKVIEKPHALFSASAVNICLNDNIVFTDLSTADSASTIASWYWSFGDGGYASVENPTHTFTVAGTDTVSLVVKNGCGCADTFRMIITVSGSAGPVIECASIECDSESATYSTSADTCGIYHWSVIGGTIVSGAGTMSIVVKWNSVGPDGFGYVRLAEPCAVCPDTTTIKVPVILQNATIEGPSVICANQQYVYSLPLWAATQYKWGVLGFPGAIVGYRDDYTVTVMFTTPGTYTLHGWYQNRIKLCGGNEDKTITVMPATSILGSTTVCQYSTDTFAIADTAVGAWSLSDLYGTVVASGSGTTFVYTFTTQGVYVLTATGSFCANPLTITVPASPVPIDSVIGQDTICLGHVYTYTAMHDVPGTTYNWSAIGGSVSPASGSAKVSVVWTSSGTKQLIVSRISMSPPYCSGLPDTIDITKEVINPDIVGDTAPCANSYRTYTATYLRGDTYDWQISPNTAGSVTAGNHGAVITALWNNVTSLTTATIIVTAHKCDTIGVDTLLVTVNPSAATTLTASADTACPGALVAFTATSGGLSYFWDFGDGTTTTTPGNSITYGFPANTTTANISYTVKVLVTPDPSAPCPASGTASVIESILPGPVAYASSAKYTICPGDSTLLVGTVTSNVSGLDFQWYSTGGIIPGATDTTYLTGVTDTYYFTDTAGNGCSTTSNSITIAAFFPCGGDSTSGDTSSDGTHCSVAATASNFCNTISLDATALTGKWTALVPPLTPLPSGTSVVATYGNPGIYSFSFAGTTGCGHVDTTLIDTVGVVVQYDYRVRCGFGADDTVTLVDHTAYLPFWYIDSISWYNGLTWLGNGPNLEIEMAAPGTYAITDVVSGHGPDGSFVCSLTSNVSVPARPSAAFTDATSPICEGVPISFTPSFPSGVATFDWHFGDGSSNLLENPQRTYKWTAGVPQAFVVSLTVVDFVGCIDSASTDVDIYQNTVDGRYSLGGTICSSAAPFSLSASGLLGVAPYVYRWSDGAMTSTDNIYVSGTYWVTISDAHKCQKTFFPGKNVRIIKPPIPVINGLQKYCIHDAVQLSGFVGTGVIYQWFRNGISDGTTAAITDTGLAVGHYGYQLVLGITDTPTSTTCYDTSAVDSIYIYDLPPAPTIVGPVALDCSSYALQLTASEAESGTYNWSDGNHGAVDNINSGGPYRVWFTDLNGCIQHSEISVPMAPDVYFPYFPVGCYLLCTQQLPLTLYGPPDVRFDYWAWLLGGGTVLDGTGLMSPYNITSAGDYQWTLGNTVCQQTSGSMDVSLMSCGPCNSDTFNVSLSCDPSNPASYTVTIQLNSPASGSSYTLGTDIGPIDPFSGTCATSGWQLPMTLTFTTLADPLPATITIQVLFTLPDGSKCFHKESRALPSCTWISERHSGPRDTIKTSNISNVQASISSALLVYPNPASGEITISFDYGSDGFNDRVLSIYDELGRKTQRTVPQSVHGSWNLNTTAWAPGIYIVRMEADGKALQTQRIVIRH